MEYKKTNIAFIIIFLLIILVPVSRMNLKENAVSKIDNRMLAPNPIDVFMNGGGFIDAANAFIKDRIGFREEMINLNSRIDYFVFHKSPVPSVIFGKEGWLFYNSGIGRNNGVNIQQYFGTISYTEEQLKTIADNLTATEEYLKKRNCEFILFIAPNKERVYTEFMPEEMQRARISEQCNTEQVIEYLQANTDIRIIWPYESIKSFKQSNPNEPIYYHLDTHWNNLGGYIGARDLLHELKIEIPEPTKDNFKKIELSSGDLYNMTALENALPMTDTDYTQEGFPTAGTKVNEEAFTGCWTYSNTDKDARKFFMCRDSFGTAMRNVIGSEFNEVNLCHTSAFSQSLLEEEQPDIFVYEIVERSVDALLTFRLE